MTPQELQARVLYRDGSILVIDKPAGLAVHPGPSTPESLERHLPALRFGIREVPRLVHRLDRDTSGCLVLARHARGASKLGRLFSSAAVKKIYWAIVEGAPPPEGVIDRPLRKITRKDGWHMAPDPAGQSAVTRYRMLGSGNGITWLELAPETGRTHQLRVHCAAEGFPVLGDPVYGRDAATRVPLHLHARSITIPLGGDRPPITVTAEPPEHMFRFLRECGYKPLSAAIAGEREGPNRSAERLGG
ncbi:MAG TPA: RNA pseudouridine synthase [Stellaceae bacterium]|nr:RNA pseudouridine synthase [Stellaceae bacterium]